MTGRKWQKIRRPDALPRGLDTHRAEAAQALVDFYTGGQPRGDLGARIDFLTGRADRSVADLITDIGTVRDVAQATGAAERTVRDWRAGTHAPSAEHRAALEKEARRATVETMGGTNAVAELTGRKPSSVRNWIRKRTAAKGDAVHQLNRREVHTRHAQARQQRQQAPTQPLYLKVKGVVRVRAKTDTPQYDAERRACLEVTPDLQQAIEDAIARGEPDRVHELVENALTGSGYAGLGDDLYDGRDFGFFLDRIDSWDISTSDQWND
jgi:hypothetical protein